MSRQKFKGSKYTEPFVGIVRSVFDSPAFTALSPFACKLLLELAGQYRGDNNGNLTVAWSIVSKRGWRSRTTLYRELFALTWFPLDVNKKFDHEALACFESKPYRKNTPLPMPTIKKKIDWTLPNGGRDLPDKTEVFVHQRNMELATSPPQTH